MNLSLNLSKRTGRAARSGFTLIEIMLVVVIIVLLLGFAIGKLTNNVTFAKMARAEGDITSISTQLMAYEAMNGALPSTQQGLKALVTKPEGDPRPRGWIQLMKDLPEDPFHPEGKEYTYIRPGVRNPTSYDLFSLGIDGKPNTGDEIGNWKNEAK
ncbi:MAG: type II secretion system major pseudopilin GspG [Verrucomicrobiota bacterium]